MKIPRASALNRGNSAYTYISKGNNLPIESIDPFSGITDDVIDEEELGWTVARRKNDKEKASKSEEPKVAFGRNRARVFGHFFLFHAIPLAGAIALIVINVQGWFLGVIGGSWISSLQFVAKVHEMLMQASIGVVTLAYVQYLLIHERSIPFGALFSYYQINQLSYLWSSEFYAAVTTPSFHGFLRTGFLLFIPFSMLLATGVGPSSAIAMQPRILNFTIPDQLFAFDVNSSSFYPDSFLTPVYGLNQSSITNLTYSTYVRDKSIEWENLQRLPSIDGSQDIATGWQTKMVAIDATSSTEISVMPPLYSVNIENGYVANRQLYVQYAPNSTFASIQHFPVAAAMYQASSLFEGFLPRPGLVENQPGTVISSIKMPQPVVSVLCNMNSITDENDTRPIQFPNTYIAGCGGLWRGVDECSYYMPPPLNTGWATTNYTGISRNQIWNQAKDFGEGRIIWVDDIPVQGPTGLALGAIVVQPQVCGTATNKTFLTTSACVIAGVWANATTTAQMDSSSSFSAQSSFDPTTFGNLSEWSRPPVKLSKAWAESLNPLTGMENRTVADNLLRWMPVTKNLCPLNGDFEIATEDGSYPENTDDYRFADTRPFMHEALLASLVANGMSYAADNASRYRYWNPDGEGGWMYTNLTTRQDAFLSNPPGIVLTFHGHLPGYAMTLDGIPIKIAIPILLLYCIYTIAYLAYTFISGRSSRVWSTMSGFTALAINSTPTEVLKHTSAGIKHTETFRNMVSVREVENHDRLELVFDQDVRALKKVMVGRGY